MSMLNACTLNNECLNWRNHTQLAATVDNDSYIGLVHKTEVHLKRNLTYTGKAGLVVSWRIATSQLIC